jgi:hypothetical protein
MEPSAQIRQLVSDWFAAATRGDASLVDELVSTEAGTCLIGSDPTEWFSGGTAVREFLRGEVTSAAGRATFTPTGTEAYQEGTVGWATSITPGGDPRGAEARPFIASAPVSGRSGNVGTAYVGSNPSPATSSQAGLSRAPDRCRHQVLAALGSSVEEPPERGLDRGIWHLAGTQGWRDEAYSHRARFEEWAGAWSLTT